MLVAAGDLDLERVEVVDRSRHASRIVGWSSGIPITGDMELAFDRGVWGTAAVLVGLASACSTSPPST